MGGGGQDYSGGRCKRHAVPALPTIGCMPCIFSHTHHSNRIYCMAIGGHYSIVALPALCPPALLRAFSVMTWRIGLQSSELGLAASYVICGIKHGFFSKETGYAGSQRLNFRNVGNSSEFICKFYGGCYWCKDGGGGGEGVMISYNL